MTTSEDGIGASETPPASSMAAPGPLKPESARHDSEVGDKRARWAKVGNALILAVVAFACAYLLTPGIFSQHIPYGEESLGKFSETVVKATRDYDIRDVETTSRKREEAREANLPVYDYDFSVADGAVQRVASAFELMRTAAKAVESNYRSREPERVDDPKKRPIVKKDDGLAEALMREFSERRDEWARRLEASLDDEAFHAFAEARFSEHIEREIERLIVRANGQMVAEYRDPLALSAIRGIVVRRKSGGEAEKVINDVSNIRDQHEIRQEVERWTGEISPEMTGALRKAIVNLVGREIRANLRYNNEETEERKRAAMESVKPVVIQLKKGEKIIGDGERIERRHLVIFAAMKRLSSVEDSLLMRIGGGLLAAVVVLVVHGFARAAMPRFRPTRRDALFGALTIVGMLSLVKIWIAISDDLQNRFPRVGIEALYHAAPFAAGAMLIRFVLNSEAAIAFTVIFAGLSGVLVGNSLEFGLYSMVGSLVAASEVARAKDRSDLFRAGLYTGLANAALTLCFALLSNKFGWSAAVGCACGFLGGAIAVPILVMGVAPFAESVFGYTTDVKLLELANLNHPALKELIVQAPGTYHHSIIIGSLVEAAAEAIGANPLLARVCAYYHDIGKGKNPLYFGENQRGENRHDRLAPQMSALIVKRHVTDGVEMARQYKLPKRVSDAIPQHHGTRLVGYFFHKAIKEQEGNLDAQPVDENFYRYNGPKPQTREVALVMIADAVEASSRAMQDPTPAKLQALVQKIINGIFADGQLDECELTLRDLNEIARAFFRTLTGIYHTRPDYPAQALQGPRPALTEVKDGKTSEQRPAIT